MIYKIQNIHVEKKIYYLIEGQMRISNGKQGLYKIPSGRGKDYQVCLGKNIKVSIGEGNIMAVRKQNIKISEDPSLYIILKILSNFVPTGHGMINVTMEPDETDHEYIYQ